MRSSLAETRASFKEAKAVIESSTLAGGAHRSSSPTPAPVSFSGSTISAPPSKSALISFHSAMGFYNGAGEEPNRNTAAMLGFHHQLYPQILSENSIRSSDENFPNKPFREDLFKEQEAAETGGLNANSTRPGGRTEMQDHQETGSVRMTTAAPNVMPMWAVASAAANGGNAFWMLPVGGGAPASTATPEAQMWPFSAHYAGGGGRVSPVQLGFVQQQVGGQQLGLGVSPDNSIGGVNAYGRVGLGMNLGQQQHHRESQNQGSESGDDQNHNADSQ